MEEAGKEEEKKGGRRKVRNERGTKGRWEGWRTTQRRGEGGREGGR